MNFFALFYLLVDELLASFLLIAFFTLYSILLFLLYVELLPLACSNFPGQVRGRILVQYVRDGRAFQVRSVHL